MLKLEIRGVESLKRLANAIEEDFRQSLNLSGSEQEIAKVLSDQNRRQFQTESDAEGGKWRRLSPVYEKRKRRIVGAKPILQFSGLLKDSLENPQVSLSDRGKQISVRYTGPNSELIGIQAAMGRKAGGLSEESKDKIQAIAFKKVSEGFSERLKRRRVR